jgi:protein phosphatase
MPTIPADRLLKIDMTNYFKSAQDIVTKIEETVASSKSSFYDKKSTGVIGKDKENSVSVNKQNILVKNNNNSLFDTNTKSDNVFRLANQAVVVRFGDNNYDDMGPIMKVSIDKLNDEYKRIGYENIRSQVHPRRIYNEDLINKFIETLLRPFDWYSSEVEELHKILPFSYDEIDGLINEAAKWISKDDTLVKLRSPAKIFGNINGQYNDLMRFFESYGHPSDDNTMGDIHLLQYIFLGDFCDRGTKSLEVILLLLALKVF